MTNQILDDRVILEDFTLGIAPASRLGGVSTIAGLTTTRGELGQFMDGGANPFAFGQYGYLASRFGVTNVTNMAQVTDTPRNIVVTDVGSGEAYMMGSAARFYQVTGANFNTVTNGADDGITYPDPIATGTNGYDCILYNVNGTDYVFFTWDTGSASKIGHLDYNAAGAGRMTDTFQTLNSTTAVPLPLTEGGDGFLYIGDGNKIDSIDGTLALASSYTSNVLDIPARFVISSIISYGDYLAILAYAKTGGASSRFSGKCGLFFWDYRSPSFEPRPIYIDDNFSGALFVKDGLLYGFTQGKDEMAKIRVYSGSTFEVVAHFGLNVPRHGNPDVYRDQLIWGTVDGGVYTWGKSLFNGRYALNNIAAGGAGFVKTLLANSTNYHFHTAGASAFASSAGSGFAGNEVSFAWIALSHRSDITGIRLYYYPLDGSGESLTVKIDKNSENNSTTIGTITFTDDNAINEVSKTFAIQNIKDVDNFQLILSYPGSVNTDVFVRKIEVFYTPTAKAYGH